MAGTRHIYKNAWRPRQNGRHFADDILTFIFLNYNIWLWNKISLKFVPKGPINNMPALFQTKPTRRHTIIWTNDGLGYRPRYASLGLNELTLERIDQRRQLVLEALPLVCIICNPWITFSTISLWTLNKISLSLYIFLGLPRDRVHFVNGKIQCDTVSLVNICTNNDLLLKYKCFG